MLYFLKIAAFLHKKPESVQRKGKNGKKYTDHPLQNYCNACAVPLQYSCSITANIFAVTLHSICSTTAKRMQQECSNNTLIISPGIPILQIPDETRDSI